MKKFAQVYTEHWLPVERACCRDSRMSLSLACACPPLVCACLCKLLHNTIMIIIIINNYPIIIIINN